MTTSSIDKGMPVARTRMTLKNVPAERATLYSDETHDVLSARLMGFIHQHMPVRQVVGGLVTPMQVNRADVVTLESVEHSNDAPDPQSVPPTPGGEFRRVIIDETQFTTLTKALDCLDLHGDPAWAADIVGATAALCSGEIVR